jgi:hypothetical protein
MASTRLRPLLGGLTVVDNLHAKAVWNIEAEAAAGSTLVVYDNYAA